MPRPKTHDDELRVRLVEAAARLLAEEGPHALSTRRVAAEVGTSTSAIYSLLGSKHELFRAMYLEGFERLAERLAAVPHTDDPVADLAALGLAYHESAVVSPNLYHVMFGRTVAEFCPEPDDAAFALGTLEVLVDAVRRCIDEGAFAGDAHDLALELWALGHGVASLTITGMYGTNHDALHHLGALYRAALVGFAAPIPHR